MNESRPPLDWNKVAWAVGGVAAVLGTLLANVKSCATSATVEEYILEDSLAVIAREEAENKQDRRLDSLVVAMDRLSQATGGKDRKTAAKRKTLVRRAAEKTWWKFWLGR